MRLSTSTNIYAFDQGKNYAVKMEDSIRICAEAGYKYIDANLCGQCRPGMPLSMDDWETWAHRMREVAEKFGVRITQAHASFPTFEEGIVHSDGTRLNEEYYEEMMRRCVLAAEILEVEWMVVHPFTMNSTSGYSPKSSFEYNREYYSRWGEFYEKHNVGMAVENMSGNWYFYKFANTDEELLELIEVIDNPMVRICIDTGHAHLSDQNIGDMIRSVGKELRAMHIDDNHGGKVDEHVAPFYGNIDWPKVMKALKEIDYQYDFSFEIHHLGHVYPKEVQLGMVKFSYALGKHLLNL